MPRQTQQFLAIALCAFFALPAVAWADRNFRTINESVRLDEGESAGTVQSVNGGVRLGDNSSANSVQSVNGDIDLGEDVKVEEDVSAVNGAIELERGVDVGGNVESVNGAIRVRGATVAGDVETVNGDIRLLDGTVIEGNVRVKKPWGWSSERKPVKVELGEDVQVKGDLIFENPVELKIHGSARFREMIGEDIEVREG